MSEEENEIYSFNQKIIYEIVKKEDKELINVLKDYAIKNSAELRLLDEDKVKEIIKKGLMVYHAEECKCYSHNYISKDKIREFKNKFIKDSKNEKVFMTQSSQINASLIQFCNELLEERN